MERTYIATGKTIDLAIQAALEALSMDRDSVSVEVLENAKSGFLGIGASPAKVKVTYEVPDETNKATAALSSASRSKPKKEKPKAEQPKVVNLPKAEQPRVAAPLPVAEQPRPEQPKADKSQRRDRRDKNRAKADETPKPQKQDKPRQEKPKAEPKEYAPAAPGSMEERIEQFIQGLLQHMGSDAVPHCAKTDEDSYLVELVGDNLGMLIGRRGETLDAIQHLTNYTINRDASKRSRINVDAESYRAKREESLRRLARKVAGKVTRYRRNFTLEPMNAY